MSDLAKLSDAIKWIARADFYNRTPRFGGVSSRYRTKFIAKKRLNADVEFYVNNCVPSSIYEDCSSECWLYLNDNRDFGSVAHKRSYSEVLSGCGFLIIATDQGGNPLLVEPEVGRVYSFQFGYLRGGILTKPGDTQGWIEVPATLETVREWSQFSWDNLQSLFDDVQKMTTKWHRGGLLKRIATMKIPELKHCQTLGLGVGPDMVDAEGRGPLEIAHQTGNKEVIAIVEAIMKENP